MGIKNRIARLEGHHPGAEEIGPVVVHFVSPVEGEGYGMGYATFLGTGIPQIWRDEGETREEFEARADQIWSTRDRKARDRSEVI
ncbi:hypothetical protein K3759_09630 [Sulfitobacter sp. W027]|uniref:hypothetical protein n=1 Tax=Sulfitobacter sp. W027 TaxID=2867025 RepID=UPI0021A80A8E|nr:hypothetical protein [Sulfitobacter sp. W027]UWR32228.1 hypothetical protein K3759_09630 [Sulfitobacter sp. W027]